MSESVGERPAGEARRTAGTPLVRSGLLLVCALALVLGSLGLTNEASLSPETDMPRYMMNGVYLWDLLHDRPFHSIASLVLYTQHYYARYPALSIGFHPLLTPVAEVVPYALVGISAAAAKLVPLTFFLLATASLYLLVAELWGPLLAVLATTVFVTNPYVLVFAHSPLSEMPTLALIIATAYLLHTYCVTGRWAALVGCAGATVLSLYGKQLAVEVLPGLLVYLAWTLGPKRLLTARMVGLAAAVVLLTLPIVPMTLMVSQHNVAVVLRGDGAPMRSAVQVALAGQFTLPVLCLALVGAIGTLWRRDRRSRLFWLWVASVLVGLLLLGRSGPERYGLYWVPAICVFAALTANLWPTGRLRWAGISVVVVVIGLQFSMLSQSRLAGAGGYEEAAQFVLGNDPGQTVLFSGDIDSGFFTFFVRAHDPARRLVVLRADKLFTTSFGVSPSIETRIKGMEQAYGMLKEFGTRYVVIEDRPSEAPILEAFRQELRSARFVERRRFPLATTHPKLRGTAVAVYEFLDHGPPDSGALLDIHMPLVGRNLSVPLSDLFGAPSK